MNKSPKVTVVTITYNLINAGRKETFLQCVESVKNQTYDNIEHIIIDGASTDGTLDLIKSTGLKYYSEPDTGIYDAMNKGIDKAEGKYIAFLNSDDYWHGIDGVRLSIEALEKENADFSYGTAIYLDENDNIQGIVPQTICSFFVAMPFLQQTVFISKEKMLEVGYFDLSYKSASDYDYMLRLILSKAKGVEVKEIFTSFRNTGFSQNNYELSGQEVYAIQKKNFVEKYNIPLAELDKVRRFRIWRAYINRFKNDLHPTTLDKLNTLFDEKPIKMNRFEIKNYNSIRPIRILFNAEVHSAYDAKAPSRSGIYFVEDNILKEFAKYPFLQISLTAPEHVLPILERFLKDNKKFLPNVNVYYGKEQVFDIYFSSFYEIPSEVRKTNITKYTIAYDLIPLLLNDKHHSGYKNSRFFKNVESWTNDDYFFSISAYTKSDLIKYLPKLEATKITTTLLAAGENFYQDLDKEKHAKIRAKYNIPQDKKYIFSLCTLEPRKNLIFSIKNFINFIKKNNIDDLILVLGGGHWEMFIKELEKTVDNLDKYKLKIIKAGYVDDEDLASLYSNAECSVYTSIYEGFGLPPLEAMQCGCPVITSNTTSLPEVVGDSGIMIDPTDDDALVEAYEKLYFDEKLRKSYVKKGLERARQFSWEKCSNIMVDIFLKNPYTPTKIKLNMGINFRLFGLIPLLSLKKKENVKKLKILGLTILRVSKSNCIVRISALGIPVLKTRKDEKVKRVYFLGFLKIYEKKIKK